MAGMHHPTSPQLLIVPGPRHVLFVLRPCGALQLLSMRASRFLVGLRAACAALSFDEPVCHEHALEELLPWAGNV